MPKSGPLDTTAACKPSEEHEHPNQSLKSGSSVKLLKALFVGSKR